MESKLHIATIGIVLIAFLIVPIGFVSGQSWTYTGGPYRPHEVRDLSAAKVGSVQTIYAADVETLKSTTNGATTWFNTPALMFNPKVVAVKPDDASIVHVGKLGWLERSTNWGNSWDSRITDPNLVPLRLAVSTYNMNIWLMGTDTVLRSDQWTTSLYRTSDDGVNWYP